METFGKGIKISSTRSLLQLQKLESCRNFDETGGLFFIFTCRNKKHLLLGFNQVMGIQTRRPLSVIKVVFFFFYFFLTNAPDQCAASFPSAAAPWPHHVFSRAAGIQGNNCELLITINVVWQVFSCKDPWDLALCLITPEINTPESLSQNSAGAVPLPQ